MYIDLTARILYFGISWENCSSTHLGELDRSDITTSQEFFCCCYCRFRRVRVTLWRLPFTPFGLWLPMYSLSNRSKTARPIISRRTSCVLKRKSREIHRSVSRPVNDLQMTFPERKNQYSLSPPKWYGANLCQYLSVLLL